jgi:hypothetical protein
MTFQELFPRNCLRSHVAKQHRVQRDADGVVSHSLRISLLVELERLVKLVIRRVPSENVF